MIGLEIGKYSRMTEISEGYGVVGANIGGGDNPLCLSFCLQSKSYELDILCGIDSR
jgi:hypothetical protein